MSSSLYLVHHGIKGMKWGVRRFQNPDGTLTEAGRKRYLNKDGSLTRKGRKAFRDSNGSLNDAGLAYYNSQGYGMKREKHSGVYSRVSGNGGYFQPSETATGKNVDAVSQRLHANAEKLLSEYSEADRNAQNAIKEVAQSKEYQKEAQAWMMRELGPSGSEDTDFEEVMAWDVASIMASNYASETESGKKAAAYEARLDAWWDDARNEADRLVTNSADIVVGTSPFTKNEYTYKDVVYSTLVDSAPAFFASTTRKGVLEPYLYDSNQYLDAYADQILKEYRNSHK